MFASVLINWGYIYIHDVIFVARDIMVYIVYISKDETNTFI